MSKLLLIIAIVSLAVQIQAASFIDPLYSPRGSLISMKLEEMEQVESPRSYTYNIMLNAAEEDASQQRSYSPAKEGLLSFILPGLGAYRMDHMIRSRIYFGLEGLSWIAIGSFIWMGYAREKAYKDYAVAYAGVSGTSYPDDYYTALGQYISSDGPGGYNEYIRREARDMYYPDTDAIERYYEQHAYTGSMAWRWRTYDSFRKYNVLRSGSESAYRDAVYAAMFALVVRVVSSVDAAILASGRDKGYGKGYSINFDRREETYRLYFSRSF